MNIIKQTAAALVIAAIAFVGCKKNNGDDPEITMTTAITGEADFQLRGTGTATIYWGDGSAPETVTLSATPIVCTRTFSGTTPRTSAIDGKNITFLECRELELTALDVSKNTALEYLSCYNNKLTALGVSKNTALTRLDCYSNDLTILNVSNNMALTYLRIYSNKLTALDVSKHTALTTLYCCNNKLTVLDVSKNTVLRELWYSNNQLEADGLNALFGTLNDNAGNKSISFFDNPGAGTCDQSIATAKGWAVLLT